MISETAICLNNNISAPINYDEVPLDGNLEVRTCRVTLYIQLTLVHTTTRFQPHYVLTVLLRFYVLPDHILTVYLMLSFCKLLFIAGTLVYSAGAVYEHRFE